MTDKTLVYPVRYIIGDGGAQAQGTALKIVQGAGATLSWSTSGSMVTLTIAASGGSGSGDVVGPASATNNNIAVFDGTTGKLIKDGGATVASLVPTTRTVNGHALSGNVTVTAADLSLVIGTDVQAWDTDLDAYAALSSTGLVARTGSGTASVRTLTAGSSRITVTDGNGVSGNPTIDAGPTAQIDLYTTAGTSTGLTIPTWATTCRVICVGGGGGSGSGRRAAAATNAMGGGGGCGGGFTDLTISAAALRAVASTYDVTRGAGGTAGAAQTVDSTNGNSGGAGGASSFVVGGNTYAYAPGGPGGPGGTATSAGATAATAWQQTGGAGGAPGSGAGIIGGSVFVGPGGGGAGGWLTSGGGRNDGSDGGAGSKARDNHTGTAAASGSGAAGVAPSTPLDGFCGDGAAGGAASSGAAGGSGAAGIRGSGASGGGASRNGNNSGAGAVGGDGWIMVIWT